MTNLEHFKSTLTAENLCDKINCCECPMFPSSRNIGKPCFARLKEWAGQEYKKGTADGNAE